MDRESGIQAPRVSVPLSLNGDLSFKCIMLGEAGVGKTTLFKRITSSRGRRIEPQRPEQGASGLPARTQSTLSPDVESRNVLLTSGYRVRLELWDTAGLERLNSLTYGHYRGAKAVFLVYDAARRTRTKQHLDDLRFRFSNSVGERVGVRGGGGRRFSDTLDSSESNVLVFLLANKIDQGEDFVLTDIELQDLSEAASMPIAGHFRVCGLTGQGVEEVVQTVGQGLLDTRQKSCLKETPSLRKTDSIRLEKQSVPRKKKWRCF